MNGRFYAGLLALRLGAGAAILLQGIEKMRGGWTNGTALLASLSTWIDEHKTYGFFLPIARAAQAHPKLFGTLIALGELGVGASLVLGLASRLGGIMGTLLFTSITLASGQSLSPPGPAALLALTCFTFIWLPPGRFLGIDQGLRGRLPRWMA